MKYLYFIRNGKLDKNQILDEHNLSTGATEETYLCRCCFTGRTFTCSKDFGFLTEKEAWADHLTDLNSAINNSIAEIERLKNDIHKLSVEKIKVEKILEDINCFSRKD